VVLVGLVDPVRSQLNGFPRPRRILRGLVKSCTLLYRYEVNDESALRTPEPSAVDFIERVASTVNCEARQTGTKQRAVGMLVVYQCLRNISLLGGSCNFETGHCANASSFGRWCAAVKRSRAKGPEVRFVYVNST
jgi:hypothetical protein